MTPEQPTLFEWAERHLEPQRTARIYDWCEPFAAKVMATIHEFDDDWPKLNYGNETVVEFSKRRRA